MRGVGPRTKRTDRRHRHGSLTGTVALFLAVHAALAAVFYPVTAVTAVGAVVSFGLGMAVARVRETDDRQVCVPGTETCVDV